MSRGIDINKTETEPLYKYLKPKGTNIFHFETLPGSEVNATMRAVSVCLILFLVTAHMSVAKILTKCQLLQELMKHNIATDDLATLVCIAQHESGLNTETLGGPTSNGAYYYGIFQISDLYWCRNYGVGGDCNLNCADLRDDNLVDDIKCALTIKDSQGFKAWLTYSQYCTNADLPSC